MASSEVLRKEIEKITELNKYNPENLKMLCEYLNAQVEENVYDLAANIVMLRIYQSFPSEIDEREVAKILLKSLMRLPERDYVMCKGLVDISLWEAQTMHYIDQLASLLETCKFPEFWLLRHDDSVLNVDIPFFDEAMRKYISHVVGATFQSIDFEELRVYLGGVDDSTLKSVIAENNWKHSDGKVITGQSLISGRKLSNDYLCYLSKEMTTEKRNEQYVVCTHCGSKILAPSTALSIEDKEFFLPFSGSKPDVDNNEGETLREFWVVGDIYTFMNVGFTNAANGFRYLCCADCERGPIGLHKNGDTAAIYVAKKRVSHLDA